MDVTLADLNAAGANVLPGHLGVEMDSFDPGHVTAHMEIGPQHMAPHGYLHAAAVVALADTSCGYGCILNLPDGARGFTTIELKTNFLRTAQPGATIDSRRNSATVAGRRSSGTRPCPIPRAAKWRSSAARSSCFARAS